MLIDCSSSPFTRFIPVSVDSVITTRGFWANWLKTVKGISIPAQFNLLEKTGRLDNFRRIKSDERAAFQGYFFNDSDVYKWLEAACWCQASDPDEKIQAYIAEVIDIISSAQDKDGYLDTYFSGEKKGERWMKLRDMHELYCAGHLLQAAIAHHRVTGREDLLRIGIDLADHICRRFLDNNLHGTPGHPEIEMALVELYRTTGKENYLRMAQTFLDNRGLGLIGGKSYHLDHVPFRELEILEGHAVRAMYLCCGATDIYLETGDRKLLKVLEKLWERMVTKQMYVSGGVGSRHQGEAFGSDYELPNSRAYAETCAAIGSLMWNWRMLHARSEDATTQQQYAIAKYADLIEWLMYNAILPGISLNGLEYHYVNPLETDHHERQTWFDCACCPTNIIRLIGSIGGYFYSHSDNNIWIHQFAANTVEIPIHKDLSITLELKTDYPWNGLIEIQVLSMVELDNGRRSEQRITDPTSFGINIRMPGWLDEPVPVFVNGQLWSVNGSPGSYLPMERNWIVGDQIQFTLPIRIRFLESHPFIRENAGRIALCRGPLLYCFEGVDNPDDDPRGIFVKPIDSNAVHMINIDAEKVTGITLKATTRTISEHWRGNLYLEMPSIPQFQEENHRKIRALPYYAWGNRGLAWMRVWVNRDYT